MYLINEKVQAPDFALLQIDLKIMQKLVDAIFGVMSQAIDYCRLSSFIDIDIYLIYLDE